MRLFTFILPLTGLLFGAWCAEVRADGGTVRIVEQKDNFQIAVFTSPTPLRAGPVDISVLIQDATTGRPIVDAQASVTVTARNRPNDALRANANGAAVTNKLLQAAVIELPEAGWWDVSVSCITDRGPIEVHFAMEAVRPLPRWLTVWPWFTWPIFAVSVFGIHRLLVHRAQRSPR